MKTLIKSKFQTTIPKAVREHLGLCISDILEWNIEHGKIVISPLRKNFLKYKNAVKTGIGNIEEDIRLSRNMRAEKYL